MLCNHYPYDVDEYELDNLVNSKAWNNNLILPSEYNCDIPSFIDKVVCKCLSIDKTNRYADATELLSEINNIIEQYNSLKHKEEGVDNYMQEYFNKDEFKSINDKINELYFSSSSNFNLSTYDDETADNHMTTQLSKKTNNLKNDFDTLIMDSSNLLNRETDDLQIKQSVLSQIKEVISNKITSKTEWVWLLLLCTPLYPISMLIMGISSRMDMLTIKGIITLVPEMLFLFYYLSGSSIYYISQMNILFNFILILWIISLLLFLLIRKDYFFRKDILRIVNDDANLYNQLNDE